MVLTALFIGLFSSCAQNQSAPEYLMTQDFPDSVMQFKVQNIKGDMITFKDVLELHKGKKVVLDFWASWCKDCMQGLPSLQSLQKETPNADYVFLSLDKTELRWKNSIKKNTINGDHYFLAEGWKNKLTNYIGLDWIPRYMILDEKGKVIYAKATKASDKEFRKILFK